MRAMIVAITDIQFHRLSIKPVTSTDITKRLMITTAFIDNFWILLFQLTENCIWARFLINKLLCISVFLFLKNAQSGEEMQAFRNPLWHSSSFMCITS